MPKLVVLDDDRLVLTVVSMGLRRMGYQVLPATDGATAVGLCRREQPDLAVLDLYMPGMDGIAVAQVLRMETLVPFIFLSAFSDEDMRLAVAETGALGYLAKPIDIPALVAGIEVALACTDELVRLERHSANLAEASQYDYEIGIAVTMAMDFYRCSRAAAFEALRVYARGQGLKIMEVAKRLIGGEKILLFAPHGPVH